MTCCSATGYGCSTTRRAPRSARPAGCSGSTAPPTTCGSGGRSGTGWKSCAPASAGGRALPNQLSPFLEERIVAFALGHPGYGPRRIASELRRERWGGIVVSHNGVWRCLRRHGRNTRHKRLSLVTGYAARYQPPRQPQPERHVEAERPGELVGMDCSFVGRLQGTKGSVWQLTAIDVCSSYAWTELVTCPRGNPTGEQTSRLARRVC